MECNQSNYKASLCCHSNSVADTHLLGTRLGALLSKRTIPFCVALIGDLGVGKTRLSQGIAKGFGVTGDVTSPTFALMNTYETPQGTLYHFDVYRLDDVSELDGIGFYEFTEGTPSIVEWADKFPEELPDETLWVTIETISDEKRTITMYSDELTKDELLTIGGNLCI